MDKNKRMIRHKTINEDVKKIIPEARIPSHKPEPLLKPKKPEVETPAEKKKNKIRTKKVKINNSIKLNKKIEVVQWEKIDVLINNPIEVKVYKVKEIKEKSKIKNTSSENIKVALDENLNKNKKKRMECDES